MSAGHFKLNDGAAGRLAPILFCALALIVLGAFGFWVFQLIASSARGCAIW
jgi:hypothetical protein